MKRHSKYLFALILVLTGLYFWRSNTVVINEERPELSHSSLSAADPILNETQSTPSSAIDIDSEQPEGRTPLMIASFKRDQEAVSALLNADADINQVDKSGQDALMNAVNGGSAKIALELLSAGANPKLLDNSGQSALSYAVGLGDVALIASLLNRGADPNLVANSAGYTMAMDLAHEGSLEALVLFINHGARVDGADNEGNTLTHHAVYSGNLALVNFVLDRGAPLEARNKAGLTPRALAEKLGLKEIALRLSGQ